MPIPIIIGGAIAAKVALAAAGTAGAVGAVKGAKAISDTKKANNINQEAKSIVNKAEKQLDEKRKLTNTVIESLGKEKIRILSTSMKDFVDNFSKLKNVNFKKSIGIDELGDLSFSGNALKELRTASFKAHEIAGSGLAGLGAGVLAGYGTYGAVGMLATASTGTSIATLSGVAASKATLAWLGGGAISAGGGGMALGAAVLGGVVVGPALLIGGAVMSSKAKQKLNSAYNNLDEAKVVAKQMESIKMVLGNIRTRSKQTESLLTELNNKYFINAVERLKTIVSTKGLNWNNFSIKEQNQIFISAQLAKTIKIVLDTPILDQDGELTNESSQIIAQTKKKLSQIKNTDFKNIIQDTQRSSSTKSIPPNNDNSNAISKLKELKELLDIGVIEKKEFENKKQELLKRI